VVASDVGMLRKSYRFLGNAPP